MKKQGGPSVAEQWETVRFFAECAARTVQSRVNDMDVESVYAAMKDMEDAMAAARDVAGAVERAGRSGK